MANRSALASSSRTRAPQTEIGIKFNFTVASILNACSYSWGVLIKLNIYFNWNRREKQNRFVLVIVLLKSILLEIDYLASVALFVRV